MGGSLDLLAGGAKRAHLPAMDQMRVFNRGLVRRRRDRAAATVARVAPILEDCADRLLDRLDDTTRRFARALDLGGRGVVAPRQSSFDATRPATAIWLFASPQIP